MPASAHPSIKVNMVLIESALAGLFLFCGMSNLHLEKYICKGDFVCRRKNGSPWFCSANVALAKKIMRITA